MAQTSVTQFAGELKVQPSVLLEQLKTRLLEYLRKVHGATEAKSKITLTRKQTSEIKKSDSTGKSRTIQVEVKKKRVFVKRDTAPEAPAEVPVAEEAPAPVAPARAPAVDAQQLELREQEQKRQTELMARQSEELREKQEREKKLTEARETEEKRVQQEPAKPGAEQAPPTDGT